jgi:hypothetical protein
MKRWNIEAGNDETGSNIAVASIVLKYKVVLN